MLAETFALVLQLSPLAFGEAPPPRGFPAPRELTCPIGELGRPWSPPAPRPLWTARMSVDPRGLRLREPKHLVNPLADILLLLALSGWASSTGGAVNLNPLPWADRTPVYTPATTSGSWAKPGF